MSNPNRRDLNRRMENPPLPRHPALQPLSREHFGGLVIARDLARASRADAGEGERRAALRRFAAGWAEELKPHFDDEERLLGPLIADPRLYERLVGEHREIERLAAAASGQDRGDPPDPDLCARPGAPPDPGRGRGDPPDPDLCARAGRLLHDHIRWEERVLFPIVEAGMSQAAAEEIAKETRRIEHHRPGARRRSELFSGPTPPAPADWG